MSHGLSVQRDEHLDEAELTKFVADSLSNRVNETWVGVVEASAKALRDLRLDDDPINRLCIYDTALLENPAHAEGCWSKPIPEADAPAVRALLMKAFGARYVVAENYRDGAVVKSLP